jgi:hypothetical protein
MPVKCMEAIAKLRTSAPAKALAETAERRSGIAMPAIRTLNRADAKVNVVS